MAFEEQKCYHDSFATDEPLTYIIDLIFPRQKFLLAWMKKVTLPLRVSSRWQILLATLRHRLLSRRGIMSLWNSARSMKHSLARFFLRREPASSSLRLLRRNDKCSKRKGNKRKGRNYKLRLTNVDEKEGAATLKARCVLSPDSRYCNHKDR